MWINLHNEWYHIKKISGQTIWATIVMLFFSSLFPYATSIVSENFSNETAQVFYGIIVIFITLSNMLSYGTLIKANQKDPAVIAQMKNRRWLFVDVAIKVVGLILSLTIYPSAMMYAVLATLLVLVIPNQIKSLRNRRHTKE
jgi:uncharacterized membrane protein